MTKRPNIIAKISSGMDDLARLSTHPNHLADIMLTFNDPMFNCLEASGLWRSLQTNLLSKIFSRGLRIMSRSKNGRIHIHCCVDTEADCSTGFSWDLFNQAEHLYGVYVNNRTNENLRIWKQAYKNMLLSMNPHLRLLHKTLKAKVKGYGFGKFSILPIRTNITALKHYYYSNIPKRRAQRDRRLRYVSAWGMKLPADSSFKVLTPAYRSYMTRLKSLMHDLGLTANNYKDVLKAILGRNWHWKLRNILQRYPTMDDQAAEEFKELQQQIEIYHLRMEIFGHNTNDIDSSNPFIYSG